MPVVGVVHEQQQIPQADQRVSTVGGGGQRIDPAMYVAGKRSAHGECPPAAAVRMAAPVRPAAHLRWAQRHPARYGPGRSG